MNLFIDLLQRASLVTVCALLLFVLIPKLANQSRVFVARCAILILLTLPLLIAFLPHFQLAVLHPEAAIQGDGVADGPAPVEIPWLLIAWGAGTFTASARYLFSLTALKSIRRKANPEVDSTAYLTSFCVPKMVDCRSTAIEVPCTFGFRSHTVLVPTGFDSWPTPERDAALRHEAAHIMRADCAWQWLANLACAIYWCHPLVWITAKVLRTESEVAADNWAIESGLAATDYAAALVEIARKNINRGLVRPLGATTLDHKLETRVVRILGAKRLGATSVVAMAVTSLALVTSMALGGLELTARQTASGGQTWKVTSKGKGASTWKATAHSAKTSKAKSRRAHLKVSRRRTKGSGKATYTITGAWDHVSTGVIARQRGTAPSGSVNTVARGGGGSGSTATYSRSGGDGGFAGTIARSGGPGGGVNTTTASGGMGGSASTGPVGGVGGGGTFSRSASGGAGGSVSAGPTTGVSGGGSFSGTVVRSGGTASAGPNGRGVNGVTGASGRNGSSSTKARSGGKGGAAGANSGGHGGTSVAGGAGGSGGNSSNGGSGGGGTAGSNG